MDWLWQSVWNNCTSFAICGYSCLYYWGYDKTTIFILAYKMTLYWQNNFYFRCFSIWASVIFRQICWNNLYPSIGKWHSKCQSDFNPLFTFSVGRMFRYNLKFWIGTTVTPNVTLMPFKLPYKYTFIRQLFSLNRLWQSIKAINIKHFTSKHVFFKPRACPLYRHYIVWGAKFPF